MLVWNGVECFRKFEIYCIDTLLIIERRCYVLRKSQHRCGARGLWQEGVLAVMQEFVFKKVCQHGIFKNTLKYASFPVACTGFWDEMGLTADGDLSEDIQNKKAQTTRYIWLDHSDTFSLWPSMGLGSQMINFTSKINVVFKFKEQYGKLWDYVFGKILHLISFHIAPFFRALSQHCRWTLHGI